MIKPMLILLLALTMPLTATQDSFVDANSHDHLLMNNLLKQSIIKECKKACDQGCKESKHKDFKG